MADLILGGGWIRTAEAMLEARFLPDAISSDVHTLSINGPALPARHDVEVSRPRHGARRGGPRRD